MGQVFMCYFIEFANFSFQQKFKAISARDSILMNYETIKTKKYKEVLSMGKADVNVNIWLNEKKRFADLFNGVLYKGKQVIRPEELEEISPVASVSIKNRAGKTRNMKKYRDIVMRWKNNATFVLLANKSQDKIHYAMPQKVMLYDGMDYEEQIRNLWKQRQADTNYFTCFLLWIRSMGWSTGSL